MKLGAESRKKVIIMLVLLMVAMFMLFRTLNTPGPQAASTVSQTPVRQSVEQRRTQRNKNQILASALDPTLRVDLLRTSEQTSYKGTGRNIFKPQAEAPPAKVKEPEHSAMIYTVPPPPPPPPINLKFFGFANKPGEPKRVFLSQGEDVFIAGEGEIVNRRYRVVRINPTTVEIEDVLTNHSEQIPLTQG